MKVLVEPVNVFSDIRGVVFEPIRPDELNLQRNAHVVISLPGAIRGNHFHKVGTEIITVTGPARVAVRENDAVRDIEVPDHQVIRFTIPPNVSHAIKNTGKEATVLMAFNTKEHDPENPDTVEDILMPI
jgi:dTDP-4-dehydrorhamnose 3,5-epimerase-like enzyme